MIDRPRLRRKKVPDYLLSKFGIVVSRSTLEKLATNGGGPLMQYSGRIPLYAKTDLDDWADARLASVTIRERRSSPGRCPSLLVHERLCMGKI